MCIPKGVSGVSVWDHLETEWDTLGAADCEAEDGDKGNRNGLLR